MKNTFLFSITLAALAAAGCSHTTGTSTNVDRTTAVDGYQNPPAADPKVAVDPTKPNSQANTVEAAANATKAALTADPNQATEPAVASTPSNVSPSSPAVASSNRATVPATNSTASATATNTDIAVTDATRSATDAAAAATASPDITTRITEWRLGATEIQADVDSGITIVRSKESIVGAPTGNIEDTVIITMVKGRLQADADVSQAMIDVEASNGEVTLKGTADNATQIGRAIALALDTQGVTKVSAEIKATARANK